MDGFICKRCGNCCRIDGQVRLTGGDIAALASFLSLEEHEFIQCYTQVARDRQGLALVDGQEGACVFLTANGCQVNPAKPKQCRDFPSAWTNPGWENSCVGKS